MKKKYIWVLVFFLSCISCKEKNKNEFMTGIKDIKGEIMEVDCLIGKPYGLTFYDALLFVYDLYEGNALTVIDTRISQCKNRVLSIGQGPGEVVGALRLSVSPQQKKLYVFQIQSGRFNSYEIRGEELAFQESVHISERPANVVAVQDAFIGIGPFERGRYHVYNKQGTQKDEVGAYPFDGEEMNVQSRFFLYQGYLCSQPDGTHFALGSSYSDNLEFYGIQENKVKLLKKYGFREVKAKFDETIQLDNDCLLGYKDSFGTERYCYMLYSGKTYSENNYQKYGAAHIFVFEWDGTFVQSYRFDKDVLAFCVDDPNKVFYGIVLENEYVIMKFEMDENNN